jgi:hypothetical protein
MPLLIETNDRKTAAATAELWRLLYDVWIHKDLDTISKETSFGKQNFAVILQDALRDLENRPDGERHTILLAIDRFLGELIRSDSEMRLRPHLEQATLLFGATLALVNLLPDTQHELGTRFLVKITQVFRTILYDDGQTKKVYHLRFLAHFKLAKAFSKNCLGPALHFLRNEDDESSVTMAVSSCVTDSIFSAENLVNYINAIEVTNVTQNSDAGFAAVMKAMSVTGPNQTLFDGLPPKFDN